MNQDSIIALAQLLAGANPNIINNIPNPNGLGELLQSVAHAENRLLAFENGIKGWPNAEELRRKVLAVDPARPNLGLVDMFSSDPTIPELPAHVLPNAQQRAEAMQVAQWLSLYVNYAHGKSPRLPERYHVTAGLWLLAVAVAGRLSLKLNHTEVYPNLYILWVARSTLFAKSTSLDVAREILRKAIPHLQLTGKFSPEGLIDQLSGNAPSNFSELSMEDQEVWQRGALFASKRGMVLDEASSLFASLKRDQNTELTEMLLRFYDGSPYEYQTRGKGLSIIKRPFLSFLGATTPIALKQIDFSTLFLNGLWGRFALLIAHETPQYLDSRGGDCPPILIDQLRHIADDYLPKPLILTPFPDPRNMMLGPGVYDAYRAYDKALFHLTNSVPEYINPNYGRLPTQTIKTAMLLATADWDGQSNVPTITLPHWHRAVIITEDWRASIHRVLVELSGSKDEDTLELDVFQKVTQAGEEGISVRELYRSMHKKKDDVLPVLNQMVQDGLLDTYKVPGFKNRVHYRKNAYSVTDI